MNNNFKPATKKQLWALSKNNEVEQLKKSLIEAIQEGVKAYQIAYENEKPVFIYDADLNNNPIKNGNKYYIPKFSGCGWAFIHIYNRRLINLFKRILRGKKEGYIGKHYIEIWKGYRGGLNVKIDKKGYDNGNINCLVEYYEAIVRYLKNKGYEGLYCQSDLD